MRVVRALFDRSLIEQPATPEPHESAVSQAAHAAHDGLELDERGRRRGVRHDAVVGIASEDAIEHHHVHVHVQATVRVHLQDHAPPTGAVECSYAGSQCLLCKPDTGREAQ